MTATNIEKHEQWTASAETLADAFTFVMEHVDRFPEPSITIRARRWYDGDITGPELTGPGQRDFEVTVSGVSK